MVPMPPHPTISILAILNLEDCLEPEMYESTSHKIRSDIGRHLKIQREPPFIVEVFPLSPPSLLSLNEQLLGKVIPVTCDNIVDMVIASLEYAV